MLNGRLATKISIRTSQAERNLLARNDVEGYYEARWSRGDAYAPLALEVVRNNGPLGILANTWLNIQIKFAGSQVLRGNTNAGFIRMINIGLADAHRSAVDVDSYRVLGLLSREQVRDYHEIYFRSLGLPGLTFGGTIMGFMGADSYWCIACDSIP